MNVTAIRAEAGTSVIASSGSTAPTMNAKRLATAAWPGLG